MTAPTDKRIEIPTGNNGWESYFALKRDELLIENGRLERENKKLQRIIDKLLILTPQVT